MEDLTQEFVDSVKRTSIGGNEGWPLTGPEVVPYYDVDQALDVYDMVMELEKRKVPYHEIGKLFQTPTMMRYHLTSSLITGLKVADKLNIRKISKDQRIKFCEIYFKSLAALVMSDPFCKDEKNKVATDEKMALVAKDLIWIDVSDGNRKAINHFSVDLFYYAWSLYYNLYAAAGFEVQGPYDVTVNGIDYELVVRENFNMKPGDIWEIDPGISSVKLYLLYKKGTNFRLSYYNQPISDSHNENLLKVSVVINGKNISNLEFIQMVSDKLSIIATASAKHINSLTRYEQMEKGAEIAFFMLKDLYKYFDQEPNVKEIVERNYKLLGDKTLNKGSGEFHQRKPDDWAEMFDPRSDSLGDIKL